MSMLEPSGTRAAQTLDLWWLMLALGLAVYAAVMGLLVVALVTRSGGRWHLSERARNRTIAIGGIILPAIILLVLIVADLRTLVAVAAPSKQPDLTVEVVGHQWWWEVRYPGQNVSTANEVHIPVNATVLLHLTAVDVIHSFWVPRLAGKTDMIPGQTNTTWIQADAPGQYRGQCAEYCGIQHANMAFTVVAEAPDQFQTWISSQQQPAVAPADPQLAQGAQAFASLGCIACHALRYGGTAAAGGGVGPDLTHVGSRSTIVAGLLRPEVDSLERWIADPNSIKQGTTMPATHADQATLRALAMYLVSLK
jgi:cytochrome c oxidase subunit 2